MSDQQKPDDCPNHYWAEPYECIKVRDAILAKAQTLALAKGADLAFAADWAAMFQYVWRLMFKGQTVEDLLKVEHYARICRERLEGKR